MKSERISNRFVILVAKSRNQTPVSVAGRQAGSTLVIRSVRNLHQGKKTGFSIKNLLENCDKSRVDALYEYDSLIGLNGGFFGVMTPLIKSLLKNLLTKVA